jgi:terpene synthase-like protein
MTNEQPVRDTAFAVLSNLQKEYVSLLKTSTCFSLLELISSEQFRVEVYCKGYSPHGQIGEIKQIAKDFGEEYGILLSNAEQYLTCAMFLFPTAPFQRLITIAKIYAIDFYLNDKMGRDIFSRNSESENLAKIKERIAGLSNNLSIDAAAISQVEKANLEVLRDIATHSPQNWFAEFLALYCKHINLAHQNLNVSSVGQILTIDEYVKQRCHVSGMTHTVTMIEYAEDRFLDWDFCNTNDIAQPLTRLHWIAAAFGALSNDLFSFEKECIDCFSDSNLVAVIAINHPEWGLKDCLLNATSMVRNLLIEFNDLFRSLRQQVDKLPHTNSDQVLCLTANLNGLVKCVQASWVWQVFTNRYKRPNSIWCETRLAENG